MEPYVVTTNQRAAALVAQISPLLAGQGAPAQGAALGELLAIWLHGHRPPSIREDLLRSHVEYVRALVELLDAP
jgi:hypothetical protein